MELHSEESYLDGDAGGVSECEGGGGHAADLLKCHVIKYFHLSHSLSTVIITTTTIHSRCSSIVVRALPITTRI